jgi:capsular exopolysaccharide synthesis family protein
MAQEMQEIDIRKWTLRILKNWYWFVLCCALFGALGIYYYFSHTAKFTVDASLMLRDSDNNHSMLGDDLMSMMGMSGKKKTDDEIAILTSRDIFYQVIKELDLTTQYRKKEDLRWIGQYPHRDLTVLLPPMFADTTKTGAYISIKVRKDDYVVKVKTKRFHKSSHVVTDLTQPIHTCAGEISFELHKQLEAGDQYVLSTLPKLSLINKYKTDIAAAPKSKDSYIINISTTTDMPQLAIDFITKEIELYNLDALVDKNIMATNTASFIEERLHLIAMELSSAETEVEQYKEKYGIVDLSSEAGLYLRESTEYRKRASEIETQLNLVQYVAEFVANEQKQNSLIPANLGISDASLVALISEYNQMLLQRMRVQRTATDDNPVILQMNMQLVMLRENIITSINSVRNSLNISKQDLEVRFSQAENLRNDIPSQEREYIKVERQRQLKEQLYLYLYKQREENALTLASSVVPAKIIAAPQMHPIAVSPRLKIIGLICMFFGCCVPIGIMILHDLFNNKFSDDYLEYEKKVGLPFGGFLVQNHHGGHIAVRNGVNSASAELFRSLRSNIRFMIPASVSNPVILVTSSINGEGKSYVATNLAISLSLLNKKVALIGLDIRKPMLTYYLDLPSKGAVTSYLAEDAYTVDDLIVKSEFENLDILPAGVIPPNPSELLQGQRLDELFTELRKRYDYVVIDSAPVALISDSFQLARVSDLTVYVSRANYTTTNLSEFIQQVHKENRLPNIVTVLNRVNPKASGYGYGYGYGYGHETAKKKKWWQK